MSNVIDDITDYNICHVIWNQNRLQFSNLPSSVGVLPTRLLAPTSIEL